MLTNNVVTSALIALLAIGQVFGHWGKNRKNDNELELTILTTWDGRPVEHRPVEIELKPLNGSTFEMNVEAPFFNDPPNPGGEAGQPFHGLWEFEVVELFLANDANQYVEIELGPWGQHIVLLLDGARNAIKHSLPLEYTAKIHQRGDDNSSGWRHGRHGPGKWFGHGRGGPGGRGRGNCWEGRAIIPSSYLPPNVTRVNAYAIHGSGENRTYEALYPVPTGQFTVPDFHRLEFFQPLNTSVFLTEPGTELSSVWQESLTSPEVKTAVKIEEGKVEENQVIPDDVTEIVPAAAANTEEIDVSATEVGTTESATTEISG